jgi:hypothetical protein
MLVPPKKWEDPYEDLCFRITMSAPDGSQKPLSEYLVPTFAQCWSFEGHSDALLRAYSRVTRDQITSRNIEPKYEGVQVRTTPKRLVQALEQFSVKRAETNVNFYPPRCLAWVGRSLQAIQPHLTVECMVERRAGALGPCQARRRRRRWPKATFYKGQA